STAGAIFDRFAYAGHAEHKRIDEDGPSSRRRSKVYGRMGAASSPTGLVLWFGEEPIPLGEIQFLARESYRGAALTCGEPHCGPPDRQEPTFGEADQPVDERRCSGAQELQYQRLDRLELFPLGKVAGALDDLHPGAGDTLGELLGVGRRDQ